MKLQKITKIGKKLGLSPDDLYPYGPYMAKIEPRVPEKDHRAKLILVTAITPTKAGEGKTTTSIALADALSYLGKKAIVALREPSLGPVFGLKGGATGGGKVTVEPSTDINLHFTGDFHALTSSINLVAAIIDNSIFQGNELSIDPENVTWRRAMDMNDRALREITIGQGGISKKTGKPLNGVERKDGFDITVAHEMMAILCLAKNEADFKKRLGDMVVAYTYDKKPVTVRDLKVTNAVMLLMKNALKPNLVQTSNGTPALIHGGPFANIAHGCNSIVATKTALALGDYVVTEAGFGSDLGAEKFLDIKCPEAGIAPDLCVVVATIRALKLHGGVPFEELEKENVEALKKGFANLERHVENMKKYGLPVLININRFASDTPKEIETLESWCRQKGYDCALNDAFAKGPKGALDVANKALMLLSDVPSKYHPLYKKEEDLKEKIERIAKEIYRADRVEYSEEAQKTIDFCYKEGYDKFYVCMAKTPMSFSDDPKLLNAPTGFTLHVKSVEVATGAQFVIPLTGAVLRMPGLPKVPAAVKMEEEKD
jgi:formate--tetrahydrofolate ligase